MEAESPASGGGQQQADQAAPQAGQEVEGDDIDRILREKEEKIGDLQVQYAAKKIT